VLPAISVAGGHSNLVHGADVTFRAVGIESSTFGRLWSVVWPAGSAAVLFVFAIGIIQQRRFGRRSVVFATVAQGSGRTIRLRRSFDEPMPMTWGIVRPQILVPKSFDGWPEDRKRVVLAHEMSHVRRFDCLFQNLAQIACAIYWFNPLFWIASDRLHRESEAACDDAVVSLGIDVRDYATHLLEIARLIRTSNRYGWSSALAMARPTTLEKRFMALLKSGLDRRPATRTGVLCIVLATLVLVLPFAAMRVSGNGKEESAAVRVDQYTTPPLYSDEGRAQGIEGIVTVEARVAADGRVERLQIVKGLGHGLDENALVAVREWHFVPARLNGIAAAASTQIDVEFSLRNAELNEEIANDMATRIGPGVVPPQVIHRVEPQSSTARSAKPSGAVILDAVIQEEGSPKIVRVIRSLDWELDEIAINALKQWRFSPAMKDGQPIKVRMNIAVNFSAN
jgi:TonB family protein